jgi:ABC-2 type transport system permease protein
MSPSEPLAVPAAPGQVREMARRSISRTLRQPALILPTFIFPLFMLAVLSSAGKEITHVKGFPTKSYITFIIAATLIQGAAGATTTAGNALGGDIETGFLSRMALTPVKMTSLVAAQLVGVAVLGMLQSIIFLAVGFAGGAHLQAGIGGVPVVLGLILLDILLFGAIGVFAAVRTGSAQQAQGVFIVLLGLLFMSSMIMPRNLITASWFKTIATYNPMSYLVEAIRSLWINGWDAEALALGVGIGLIGLIFFVAVSAKSLKTRVLAP